MPDGAGRVLVEDRIRPNASLSDGRRVRAYGGTFQANTNGGPVWRPCLFADHKLRPVRAERVRFDAS